MAATLQARLRWRPRAWVLATILLQLGAIALFFTALVTPFEVSFLAGDEGGAVLYLSLIHI